MSIKTLEDQLEHVQIAIERAENRQKYSIADREVWAADLETLYNREQSLITRIARRDARSSRGGIRSMRFCAS